MYMAQLFETGRGEQQRSVHPQAETVFQLRKEEREEVHKKEREEREGLKPDTGWDSNMSSQLFQAELSHIIIIIIIITYYGLRWIDSSRAGGAAYSAILQQAAH